MGSTKRKGALETLEPERQEQGHDSDVAASGVRVDRECETVLAPADIENEFTRPTLVPEHDIVAQAFRSSLRPARLPLDVAIPMRTDTPLPEELEPSASFLLLYVDGCSSVREIAELTALPVDEVLATFLGLIADGLVSLGSMHPSLNPASGVLAVAVAVPIDEPDEIHET